MSYVLDALRRAEAERRRGQLPGLHAPPAAADPAPSAGARRWPWAVAGLALAATLGWLILRPQAPDPAPAAAPATMPATTPATTPVESPVASPAVSAVTAVPAVPSPGPASALSALPAAAVAAAKQVPAPPPADVHPEIPPPVALPPLDSAARSAAPPRQAPPAAPPMRFGGAIDSPQAGARMLIIDGKLWREGDEPIPGWVLERIGLHGARFRVQGQTVELPYADGRERRP